MADADKEIKMERLVEQVGGRFKLTYLIQRRMRQLTNQRVFGQRRSDNDTLDQVLREIADGKIELIDEQDEPKPQDLL